MHGWRAVLVAGAMLALALAFPGIAAADPSCPSAVALDAVHTGGSVHGDISCDDPSGTSLSYSVVGGGTTTGGFASPDGLGGLDYYANSDYAGPDAFTVEVDDQVGGSTTISVSVQVVDQAPVCHDVDLGTVPRNQTAFGDVDCTDPDGDPMTYDVTQPAHGSAASSGDLEYTPDPGFSGADGFTYTASDGALSSDPANVAVSVANHAPTCDADSQTLRTGKPIQLTLSCSDIDGDPLTVTVASIASHGTLGSVTDDGFGGTTVTYTPTGSYTGSDSFTFRASDGDKQSAPVTFALTITPNHAPVCVSNGAFHTRVNTVLSVFAHCTDEDAQDASHLTYTAVGGAGPAHGSLGSFSGPQVHYTPDTDYAGTDQFRVRASDGTFEDTADIPLHVANGPLCSTPPAATVRSGRSRELGVDCTQPDDVLTALSYEVVSPPTQGHLDSGDASFDPFRTYTANAGASGADSYSIRAVSGGVASDPVVQAITTGSAVNNPPECDESGGSSQVYAGRPDRLYPSCSDPDGDPLTYSVPSQPAHGTSSVSNNQLSYLAAADYTGTDSVPYTASDGHGGNVSAAIPVDVAAPERPTCDQGPITATVRPGGHTTLQLDCFSPQGDPQSYSVEGTLSKGSLGTFDDFGGVRYTADANASGQETFSLRAGNAVGQSDAQPVTITIDPDFNRAPVCDDNSFAPEHVVTHTATPLRLDQVCSDPDGDPLVFVRKSQPASGGTLSAGPAATLSYTSPASYLGADQFTFVARDSRGLESPVTTHALDVVSSLAPTCTAGPPLSLRPGQSRDVTFDCQDLDDNPITYKIVSGPASGTLSPSGDSTDPTRTYTAPGTAGDGSFTYRATSRGGDSTVYSQTVTVDPTADQAPTCVGNAGEPQRVAQQRATQLAIAVWCDDPDNDPLTFTRVTPNPLHGTATASGGKITYTSVAGYTGTDTIGYQAADGHGKTTTGTFTVDVEPVTPPTCSAPGDVSVRPSRSAEVTFDCTDAFDSPMTYHIVTAPGLGTLDPAGNGPDAFRTYDAGATEGNDTFSYEATSENGTSTTVTQTVHVTHTANTAPVCRSNRDSAEKVAAGHARTLHPGCSDDDGDALSYAKLGNPAHGTLSDAGGALAYTPDNGFTGQDSFNYAASDGHGGTSAPQAFFVDVIQPDPPACDAPTAISVRPGGTRSIDFSCADVLGDPLSYVIGTNPAHGTLTGSGESRTYHAGSTAGSDSFTWHAHSDSTGDSATQTQPITITTAANAAPACPATFSATGKPSVARTITPACSDEDGDALTFTKQSSPSHGTLTDAGGVLKYTAAAGYTGADAFTYRAADGHGGQSVVSTVSITVSAANTAPSCGAGPFAYTVAAGATITIPAAPCTDPDGDPLTIEIPNAPAKGTLSAPQANGTRTYTANAGPAGTDQFTFRAFDGTARSATRTVSITITAPAEPTPTPTPSPTPTPTPDTAPVAKVAAIKQKLKAALSGGVAVKATCDKPCKLGLQLVLDKATARKLKLGKNAVVVGKLTAAAGTTPSTLKIKLTGKARKAFKTAKLIKLTLKVAATSDGGTAAAPVTVKITLKK